MNAVTVNEQHQLIDQPRPRPTPHGHDVRVSVLAVSVNPADVKRVTRKGPIKPAVLGYDAVGEITGLGDAVTNFQIGQRVFYAGSSERDGSYADEQLVNDALITLAPMNLPVADVAAMPLTWLTAAEILFEKIGYSWDVTANQGHAILVINGAGGVGSVLTQLAHLIGLTVFATSSPRNFDWLREHGVTFPLDYHADLVTQVQQTGQTVDASVNLYDGDQYFEETVKIVRPFGHLVNITPMTSPDTRLVMNKSQSLDWELMFTKSAWDFQPATQGRWLAVLSELLTNGVIRSTRTKTVTGKMNAKTVSEAQAIVKQQRMTGKLVIRIKQ